MKRVSVPFRITIAALALLTGLFGPASAAIAAPPTLTVPASQTVNEGQLLTFDVSAVDPEGQSILLYTTSSPAGATLADNHNGTGTVSWTPDRGTAGRYSATFVADDGFFNGTDTKSVAISVVEANNAPVLSAIGDRTVERGTQLIISLTGYDPDGDALAYSFAGLPAFGTLYDFGDGHGALSFQPVASTPLGDDPGIVAPVGLALGVRSGRRSDDLVLLASGVRGRCGPDQLVRQLDRAPRPSTRLLRLGNLSGVRFGERRGDERQ